MADINNAKDQKWSFMSPSLTRGDSGRQILPAQMQVRYGRVNEINPKQRVHEYPFKADNLRRSIVYDPDGILSVDYSPGRSIF